MKDVTTRMSVALGRAADLGRLRLQGVALASAGNAIIIADRGGRIEWANSSYCHLSGFTLDAMIGRMAPFLSDGEPGAWIRAALQAPDSAGESWRGETVQRHADGRLYLVEQIITPLRGAGGAITHFVTIQEDITARRETERQIEYLAHHDALTGLANRVVFAESLARAAGHARREQRMLALLLLDLDRFKVINDSLGHDAGDLLLRAVADRLRSSVRVCDLVARLGGDEFAVVQTELDGADDAAALARRILAELSRPIPVGGREIHTTASIGITLFPSDESSCDKLVKNADLAMYRAKAEGRNTFQFFTERMNAEIQGRLALENALRAGLARDEFVLYYQPLADLRDGGRIVGVEALLRWQHPELGLVLPGEFIPVAEESGLIVDLGRWALRQACAQCRAWRDAELPPVRVEVNVSAVQLTRDDLAATVAGILAQTGLTPAALGLEVTETLLAPDIQASATVLHSLRRLGIRLSIDDFGTGYSSLSYLGHFPFDRLKIDKAFVRSLCADTNDMAIIRAIIGMGQALGMRVLAEGVETTDQRRSLAEAGCDEIQGYLISKPLPAEEMSEFLRARGTGATSAAG
jgi:diguanylate cyclase (GGDEF)-like protein/PAS domain S-box-containing protein